MMQKSRVFITLSVVLFGLAGTVHATLFNVELIDNNGPHITGVVDTASDTFTVNTWTENPGGYNFLTPTNLPRVYNAMTGSPSCPFDTPNYDVSDEWDGTIGPDWAFIYPTGSRSSWEWSQPVDTPNLWNDGWGSRGFDTNPPNYANTLFDPPHPCRRKLLGRRSS